MYDLLIKGGTVVDPSQGIHGANDVAIEDGKIARVAPDIDAAEASQVVEVKGKVVTPGLIDLHTHVFAGVNSNGVEPNIGGRTRRSDHHGGRRQFRLRHLRRFPPPHPAQQRHRDNLLPPHLPHRAGHHAGHIQSVQHRSRPHRRNHQRQQGHHLRGQGADGVPPPSR